MVFWGGWPVCMNTDASQGTLLNIIVGIVGAFVAGLVLTPLFGISTINQNNFSIPALIVSLLGAVILLDIRTISSDKRNSKINATCSNR